MYFFVETLYAKFQSIVWFYFPPFYVHVVNKKKGFVIEVPAELYCISNSSATWNVNICRIFTVQEAALQKSEKKMTVLLSRIK